MTNDLLGTNSLENDRALLALCTTIIDKMTELTKVISKINDVVETVNQRINLMNERISNLEKLTDRRLN